MIVGYLGHYVPGSFEAVTVDTPDLVVLVPGEAAADGVEAVTFAELEVVAVPFVVEAALELPLEEFPPPICTKPLNKIANPLICGACNSAAFTSMLSIVPPAVDPISTAAGCGSDGGGSAALGTGRIPRARSAGSDVIGIESGIVTGGRVDVD